MSGPRCPTCDYEFDRCDCLAEHEESNRFGATAMDRSVAAADKAEVTLWLEEAVAERDEVRAALAEERQRVAELGELRRELDEALAFESAISSQRWKSLLALGKRTLIAEERADALRAALELYARGSSCAPDGCLGCVPEECGDMALIAALRADDEKRGEHD